MEGFVNLDTGDTHIWTEEGDYKLIAFITIDSEGEKISLDDGDVQAILSSIGVQ